MQFQRVQIEGVRLVEPEPRADERGLFARVYCAAEFHAEGIENQFVQVNESFSPHAGTLRGLHLQVAPDGEAKLVRCIRGAAFDVLVDLRERSPTFGQWFGAELTAESRRMMFVPRGCAHGYLTLQPDTQLIYFTSSPYRPASERIVRWDDPYFAIRWPRQPSILSEKDRDAPDFDPDHHRSGY